MSLFYLILSLVCVVFGFKHGPGQYFYLTVAMIFSTAGVILNKLDRLKP